MSNWIEFFFYFIIGATLLLSIIGLWFTGIMPCMDRWSKRFFIAYFSALLICCIFSIIDMISAHYPNTETEMMVLSLLETLSLSLPVPMLTAYLEHSSKGSVSGSKLFRAAFALWTLFFVLLAATPFTKYFYYVAPGREFHRGPLFPLLMLPLIALAVMNLVAVIRARKTLSHRYHTGFLIAVIPLAIVLPVHVFFDVTALIDISTVLSAISMLGLILADQTEEQLRQQQEIANQRASVMVLQMRPHFIYNTLMSIYSLCNQDPQKARQVTMDFTNYLRKNFNAVASDNTIPFSSELEHTRAYLAVEQAQHEDMLLVDYDTPHIRFRIPPLTLQPIVENAVKHGIDPYAGPLHVLVRTRRKDTGSEITVEDTGAGFDPSDESKPHMALDNIRQRLELMCGGTLTIAPRSGGGTIVTVSIPG